MKRLRRKNPFGQPLQSASVKLEMSPCGVLGFSNPGLDPLGNAGAQHDLQTRFEGTERDRGKGLVHAPGGDGVLGQAGGLDEVGFDPA